MNTDTKQENQNKNSDTLGALLENKQRKAFTMMHSRIISALKIFFPLAALGLMAVVVFVSQSRDDFIPSTQDYDLKKPATNELIKPRFESKDNKSRPYTITAEKAIQSEIQKDKIFLDKPLADMSTLSGNWFAIEADQGEYTKDQKEILLEGNVRLFQDQGYFVKTKKLLIYLEQGIAQSDNPVQGQGPAGILKAKGLTALQKENKIVFKGPAQLILHNKDNEKILPQ